MIRPFLPEICEFEIEGHSLTIHRDNPLREIYGEASLSCKYLQKLAILTEKYYPKGWILDVGANIGDTLVFLRNKTYLPILCVEGDDYCWSFLEKNSKLFSNVNLEKAFLSDHCEKIEVGINKEGWNTTIEEKNDQTPSRLIEFTTIDFLLRERGIFDNPIKLIKVDAEGYDLKILSGTKEVILKHHPILVFELNFENLQAHEEMVSTFFEYLSAQGYSDWVYFDNSGRMLCHFKQLNKDQWMDLYKYSFHGDIRYFDVCAFHQNDTQLAQDFVKMCRNENSRFQKTTWGDQVREI